MTAKHIVFTAMIAAILGMAMPASAQDVKIGVVNWTRLLVESPQAERVRNSMQGQFASRMESLQQQQEQLQADVDRLKRDGSVMSEEARRKLDDSIRDQQRRLRLAQEEYSEDVQRAQQEEMQALQQEVLQVINDYAADQDYDLIVGEGYLYASDKINITDTVLTLLKDKQ